jgi:hypothetical protein
MRYFSRRFNFELLLAVERKLSEINSIGINRMLRATLLSKKIVQEFFSMHQSKKGEFSVKTENSPFVL